MDTVTESAADGATVTFASIRDYVTSTDEAGLPYRQQPDKILADQVWIYGAAIVIILGAAGNILSAVVMLRPGLRVHTTSMYLVVLAVVDTVVLFTGFLRFWIRTVNGLDVRKLSTVGCKVHIFAVYFLLQFEGWILVCVSLERTVAIYAPHLAKRFMTRKMAAVQLAVLAIILAALNSHFFWTYGLVYDVDYEDYFCSLTDDKYNDFMTRIWHWTDSVLASFGPFTIMFITNSAIAIKLLHANHIRKKNLNMGNDVKMTSMTAILLVVSIVYLLTTAPITVFLSTQDQWYEGVDTDAEYARIDLVWAWLNIAAYTNNAINFLLYCFSGPRFRRELVKMFSKSRVGPTDTEQSITMVTRANTQNLEACTRSTLRSTNVNHM